MMVTYQKWATYCRYVWNDQSHASSNYSLVTSLLLMILFHDWYGHIQTVFAFQEVGNYPCRQLISMLSNFLKSKKVVLH